MNKDEVLKGLQIAFSSQPEAKQINDSLAELKAQHADYTKTIKELGNKKRANMVAQKKVKGSYDLQMKAYIVDKMMALSDAELRKFATDAIAKADEAKDESVANSDASVANSNADNSVDEDANENATTDADEWN